MNGVDGIGVFSCPCKCFKARKRSIRNNSVEDDLLQPERRTTSPKFSKASESRFRVLDTLLSLRSVRTIVIDSVAQIPSPLCQVSDNGNVLRKKPPCLSRRIGTKQTRDRDKLVRVLFRTCMLVHGDVEHGSREPSGPCNVLGLSEHWLCFSNVVDEQAQAEVGDFAVGCFAVGHGGNYRIVREKVELPVRHCRLVSSVGKFNDHRVSLKSSFSRNKVDNAGVNSVDADAGLLKAILRDGNVFRENRLRKSFLKMRM